MFSVPLFWIVRLPVLLTVPPSTKLPVPSVPPLPVIDTVVPDGAVIVPLVANTPPDQFRPPEPTRKFAVPLIVPLGKLNVVGLIVCALLNVAVQKKVVSVLPMFCTLADELK